TNDVPARIKDQIGRLRAYDRKRRTGLQNSHVRQLPSPEHLVEKPVARTRNRPQSREREPVPDVEIGQTSLAAVVVCVDVLGTIVLAGLVNGLAPGVCRIEREAVLRPLLKSRRHSVVVAVLIRLPEVNVEETRR